jgi:hypothetical protein
VKNKEGCGQPCAIQLEDKIKELRNNLRAAQDQISAYEMALRFYMDYGDDPGVAQIALEEYDASGIAM